MLVYVIVLIYNVLHLIEICSAAVMQYVEMLDKQAVSKALPVHFERRVMPVQMEVQWSFQTPKNASNYILS